jgi:hypothetical protein
MNILDKIAVIALSGHLAERVALRPDAEGWRRHVSVDGRRGYHEAAHATVAHVLGMRVFEVSITLRPEVQLGRGRFSSGFVRYAPSAEANCGREADPETDAQTVARLAFAVTPFPASWQSMRARIREWRGEAEGILERHWLHVAELAAQLERRQQLNAEELMRFLPASLSRPAEVEPQQELAA